MTDIWLHLAESVRKSRRREIRNDILPARGTTAKVGPNYNGCLIRFVREHWQPERARRKADSLHRAIHSLERFRPVLPPT